LVSGRDPARGDAVVTAIRAAGGKADFIAADLGDGDSVRELARQATELGAGHVDILVNNAGVFPFGPTRSAADEDIDTINAVNVKARPSSWSPSSRPPWPPAARKRSSTC
jgi:NAD(P)-dependent dehydrogenase (short-subunit alcohol dehydrogenase family)